MVRARIFVWASVVTFVVQKVHFLPGNIVRTCRIGNLPYKSATQQEFNSDNNGRSQHTTLPGKKSC